MVSAAFRDDVRRLNRFLPGTGRGCAHRTRRGGWFPSGKFDAGQKLNSALSLGAIVILLGTGLMLHSFLAVPRQLVRTGATFVHDLTAAALAVVAAGHVWMALNDPEARRGLRTGTVTREWAEAEHALWAAEVTASSAAGEPDESGPKDPTGGQQDPS